MNKTQFVEAIAKEISFPTEDVKKDRPGEESETRSASSANGRRQINQTFKRNMGDIG